MPSMVEVHLESVAKPMEEESRKPLVWMTRKEWTDTVKVNWGVVLGPGVDILWSSSGGEGLKVGSVAIGPADDVSTGERKSYRGTCNE
jgi:hypothetical protein